jgi:O-antigen/teichoic acid export membrane protein
MTFARHSLGSLFALVFGLLASIVLARALGAEARGQYYLSVRVAGLVLAVAQWGIPEVLLQFVAIHQAQGKQGIRGQGALVSTTLLLGIGGTLGVGAAVALVAPLLADNLLRGVGPTLLWLALGGSVLAILGLLARRFIQLAGRLDLYNGLEIGRTALFLALVATLTTLLPREALAAVGAWLVAEVALAVAAVAYVWRRVSPEWTFDRTLARQLIVAGLPIQVGMLAVFLGNDGGAFVLNATLDPATVGVYTVALSVARLVLQVSMAIRTPLQPSLVAPATDAAEVTARLTRHGLLWMLLVSFTLALAAPLVPLVFGHEFAAAGPALVLLLPGMVAYGVMQLLASHLLCVGRRGFLAFSSWTFAVASIALQFLGAQAGGLLGASAGLSLASILATAIVLLQFTRLAECPARDLLPRPADIVPYLALARSLLAGRKRRPSTRQTPIEVSGDLPGRSW